MRGRTVKRLRRLATKYVGVESTLYNNPDGSVKWDGQIREYRDIKMRWKNSNIYEKGVLFND